jgi:hypothetical protein
MVNCMADICERHAQTYFDMEPLRDKNAFENMDTWIVIKFKV